MERETKINKTISHMYGGNEKQQEKQMVCNSKTEGGGAANT